MAPKHKYWGQFCTLFAHYLQRSGMSPGEFALKTDLTSQTLSTYLNGRCKAPLHLVEDFADALSLSAAERQNFLWLALEAYCPTAVWSRLQEVERKLTATEDALVNERAELVDLRLKLSALKTKFGDS